LRESLHKRYKLNEIEKGYRKADIKKCRYSNYSEEIHQSKKITKRNRSRTPKAIGEKHISYSASVTLIID
jgi:hypothetical protein